MASPQVENGYTRIANEIMEALARIRIPGEARQVLDVIVRQTYGFNKKVDTISLGQFCLKTGMKKPNCVRAINKALSMNLVIKKDNGSIPLYSINKNFDAWKPLSKKIMLSKKITSVIKKDNNRYQKRYPQKKKETPTKEIPSQVFDLSRFLADFILKNNPKHTRLSEGKYQATVMMWAADLDKLHRLDGQSIEDIRRVIEWCQSDPFWKKNILSGASLRKQWDRLFLATSENRGSSGESWR
jgi:phage replication O-like protein O